MDDSPPTPGVEDVERAYEEGKRRLAGLRRTARMGSILLACLVLGFLASIVLLARDLYAWERFEPHVAAEAERLLPEAQRAMNAVVARAGPVYARLAQEKMEASLPALQESMRREIENLGGHLKERLEPEVRGALERLEARQWERLRFHFPSLAFEKGRQEFTEKWSKVIIDDHRALLADFDLRYGLHVVELRKTMEGFRPNRFESWDRERLSRHFVHLWLQLLDRHVLSLDAPAEEVTDGR